MLHHLGPRNDHALPATLARRLVFEHGWNSTSHQVLDPGMRHWFSAAGDAVVGYVEAARMRVVAGAPVASDERLAAVAEEFECDSLAEGRQVCYFAAENRLLTEVEHRHYAKHLIGLQPIWNSHTWAQRFDDSASLRAQRNRARNKGVSVAEASPETERSGALRACHSAWLSSKGFPQLRFLAHSDLDGARDELVTDRRLFVAEQNGSSDQVVGYLMLAPVPRRRGWLVEQIIRHPQAPNGTAELLLDTALRTLATTSDRFTLGLAPLASLPAVVAAPEDRVGADLHPPGASYAAPWLRLAERVAVAHGRRLYDFAGLQAFKGKFRPDAWEPVYLLSTQKRFTPRTLLALAGAFLGTRGTSDGTSDGTAQRGWWSIPS